MKNERELEKKCIGPNVLIQNVHDLQELKFGLSSSMCVMEEGLGPLWAGETRLLFSNVAEGGAQAAHQSEGHCLVRGGQRTKLIPPAWKIHACLFRSVWIFMTPEKLCAARPGPAFIQTVTSEQLHLSSCWISVPALRFTFSWK